MKPAMPQVSLLATLRARVERAGNELNALEEFVVDPRVRPILVAADAEIRLLRRRFAAGVNSTDRDMHRRLESVESRVRLLRGLVRTLGSASAQAHRIRA